jgi:hypothetical protein
MALAGFNGRGDLNPRGDSAHEASCIVTDFLLPAERGIRSPERIIPCRECPISVRSDDGSE